MTKLSFLDEQTLLLMTRQKISKLIIKMIFVQTDKNNGLNKKL